MIRLDVGGMVDSYNSFMVVEKIKIEILEIGSMMKVKIIIVCVR